MTLLDSRASRMSPTMALLTLHADYIGGKYSNYRKWYFAAEFNKDSPLQFDSQNSNAKDSHNIEVEEMMMADSLEEWWRNKMSKLTQHERVLQVALYLLVWGEALNIRYLPEVICFLYKLAYDYYHGPICQNLAQPVPEGEYLRNVVTPLYLYIRDQNYEVVNGQFLKRERDHAQVIGYDDINETFWTKEGVNRLVLEDKKTKLMSIHPHERWTKLGNVNYKRSFIKTYYERRTWAHTLTNFSRIWIFHFATFYIFWVYNSPVIFYTQPEITNNPNVNNSSLINPRTYGAIGFGGAIASWIALSATFFEFFFVERNWKNYS
jgi:1,3-beta-glucan synthase